MAYMNKILITNNLLATVYFFNSVICSKHSNAPVKAQYPVRDPKPPLNSLRVYTCPF